MQPTLRQVPPRTSFSTSSTFLPRMPEPFGGQVAAGAAAEDDHVVVSHRVLPVSAQPSTVRSMSAIGRAQVLQVPGRVRTVDHLVVGGQREPDPLLGAHRAVGVDHRAGEDRVHAEDGHLRHVQQRGERLDPEGAEVAHREGRAAEQVGADRAADRLVRQLLATGPRTRRSVERLGEPQRRHQQAARGVDRHAQVDAARTSRSDAVGQVRVDRRVLGRASSPPRSRPGRRG